MKRTPIDVTTLSSPNGFKQFIAGLADPGTFDVEGYFDTSDSGQNALYNKFVGGTVDNYTLTFPAVVGASWTASCFIKDLDIGMDADTTKALTFKASIQINGQPNIGTVVTSGLSGLTLTRYGWCTISDFCKWGLCIRLHLHNVNLDHGNPDSGYAATIYDVRRWS